MMNESRTAWPMLTRFLSFRKAPGVMVIWPMRGCPPVLVPALRRLYVGARGTEQRLCVYGSLALLFWGVPPPTRRLVNHGLCLLQTRQQNCLPATVGKEA